MRKKRKKKLVAASALVLAGLLAVGGSLAYFTDREVTTANGTAGSLDLSVDSDGVNLLDKDGLNIFNPGDLRRVNYSVSENGNKSVDVRETILLTAKAADGKTLNFTEDQPGVELYDLALPDDGIIPADAKTVATGDNRQVDTEKKSVLYHTDEYVLSGNKDKGEAEEDSDANKRSHAYTLYFSKDADNSWQGSTVTMEVLVEGKQHRNTQGKWDTIADDTFVFSNGISQKAVPGKPLKTAMLVSGTTFNNRAKALAGGDASKINAVVWGNVPTDTASSSATASVDLNSVQVSNPFVDTVYAESTDNHIMSTPDSPTEIDAAFKDGTLYLTTDAEKIFAPADMSHAFENMSIADVSFGKLDTSLVTNTSYLFNGCKKLTTADLTHLDTANVTDMTCMFQNTTAYTDTNFTSLKLDNVKTIRGMFYGCGVESVNNKGWNTSKVTDMSYLFSHMPNLVNGTLDNLDVGNVTSFACVFSNNPKMETADFSYGVFPKENLKKIARENYSVADDTAGEGLLNNCEKLKTVYLNSEDQVDYLFLLNLGRDGWSLMQNNQVMGSGSIVGPSGLKNSYDSVSYDDNCCWLDRPGRQGIFTYKAAPNSKDALYPGNSVATVIKTLAGNDLTKIKSVKMTATPSDSMKPISWDGTISAYFADDGTLYWYNKNKEYDFGTETGNSLFSGCTKLASIDTTGWNTDNLTDMGYMFQNTAITTSSPFRTLNTSNVTAMNSTFNGCSKLTDLPLDSWDLSSNKYLNWFAKGTAITDFDCSDRPDMGKIIDVNDIVANCPNLASVKLGNHADAEGIANAAQIAIDCPKLTNVSLKNIKINNFNNAFKNCTNLKNATFENVDTSACTDMAHMFDNCKNLTGADLSCFNTSKTTTLTYMFNNCQKMTNADLSSFDTSNVTDLSYMFNYCTSLSNLKQPHWKTSKATTMGCMYRHASLIADTGIDEMDLSSCADLNQFANSTAITNFSLAGRTDTKKLTYMSYIVFNCPNLRTFDLSDCDLTALTNMIGAVQDCPKLESVRVEPKTKPTNSVDFGEFTSDPNNFDKNPVNTSLTNISLKNININFGFNGNSFARCPKLTTFTTDNVVGYPNSAQPTMARLFGKDSSLETLNVSWLNTAGVTSMKTMFSGCTNLKSITGLDKFQTTGTSVNYSYMFEDCPNIKELDLTGFETDSQDYTYMMFHNDKALKKIIVSPKIGRPNDDKSNFSMFEGCTSLPNFDSAKTGSKMFNYYDGYLTLADQYCIPYTVHFDKNSDNATGTMADESFDKSEKKALSANAYSLDGYIFTGWNTKADGSGTRYTDQQVVQYLCTDTNTPSLTLYAQWRDKNAKILHTANINNDGVANGAYANSLNTTDTATIDGASKIKVEIWFSTEGTNYDYVQLCDANGNVLTTDANGTTIGSSGKLGNGQLTSKPANNSAYHKTFILSGNTVNIKFYSDSVSNFYGYYAIVTKAE